MPTSHIANRRQLAEDDQLAAIRWTGKLPTTVPRLIVPARPTGAFALHRHSIWRVHCMKRGDLPGIEKSASARKTITPV